MFNVQTGNPSPQPATTPSTPSPTEGNDGTSLVPAISTTTTATPPKPANLKLVIGRTDEKSQIPATPLRRSDGSELKGIKAIVSDPSVSIGGVREEIAQLYKRHRINGSQLLERCQASIRVIERSRDLSDRINARFEIARAIEHYVSVKRKIEQILQLFEASMQTDAELFQRSCEVSTNLDLKSFVLAQSRIQKERSELISKFQKTASEKDQYRLMLDKIENDLTKLLNAMQTACESAVSASDQILALDDFAAALFRDGLEAFAYTVPQTLYAGIDPGCFGKEENTLDSSALWFGDVVLENGSEIENSSLLCSERIDASLDRILSLSETTAKSQFLGYAIAKIAFWIAKPFVEDDLLGPILVKFQCLACRWHIGDIGEHVVKCLALSYERCKFGMETTVAKESMPKNGVELEKGLRKKHHAWQQRAELLSDWFGVTLTEAVEIRPTRAAGDVMLNPQMERIPWELDRLEKLATYIVGKTMTGLTNVRTPAAEIYTQTVLCTFIAYLGQKMDNDYFERYSRIIAAIPASDELIALAYMARLKDELVTQSKSLDPERYCKWMTELACATESLTVGKDAIHSLFWIGPLRELSPEKRDWPIVSKAMIDVISRAKLDRVCMAAWKFSVKMIVGKERTLGNACSSSPIEFDLNGVTRKNAISLIEQIWAKSDLSDLYRVAMQNNQAVSISKFLMDVICGSDNAKVRNEAVAMLSLFANRFRFAAVVIAKAFTENLKFAAKMPSATREEFLSLVEGVSDRKDNETPSSSASQLNPKGNSKNNI